MSRYLVDFKATFYLIFCLALTLTTQALGGSIISKVPSSNWLLNDFVLVWSNTDKALQIYHKNDSSKFLIVIRITLIHISLAILIIVTIFAFFTSTLAQVCARS